MSSSGSLHEERMLDTRYSTPAPELDDHRPSLPVNPAEFIMNVPIVELQLPTPRPTGMDEQDLLSIDEALLNTREQVSQPIARDFEHAIDDDDKSDGENDGPHSGAGRPSVHTRRLTNNREGREGRTPRLNRHDRSRDTSSSRSTSPANSIEAFAEPRRRLRANTAESHSSSLVEQFRKRAYSGYSSQRRPTLSNISLPPAALTHRTDREANEDTFPTDDEPGKTYKIDFEELEEFVVLSAQGKIPDDQVTEASNDSRTFGDLRKQCTNEQPNVALNGECFYEKPIAQLYSHDVPLSSSVDKLVDTCKALSAHDSDRFFLFSSELTKGKRATKLGDFVTDGTTFRDLFEVGPDGGVWWLDVLNPTKAELNVLCKAFKIHRLTQEDIETQEAREKVELFSQYYFVCFRSFNMDVGHDDFLDPIHVYILVCADGVLSFSYTRTPHAKNVRKRISKLGDFLSLGPDYICYAMIDDIVDSFAPIIRQAEQESEGIEDHVFIARENDYLALLRQIGECRKRVLNMMRLLGGKADVIKGFAKRCNDQYQMTPRGDIGLYLGDIQDHVVTMMSNLGHVEKMLSRSHANYLAQINVDNILKGNHTNKNLAKITVLATILVPLNLITGLFGMNVNVPGKNTDGLWWFGGILGLIAIFVIVGLGLARKIRMI